MLSNAYFLAKFRFDTAENEPAQNLQNFAKFCQFSGRYDLRFLGKDGKQKKIGEESNKDTVKDFKKMLASAQKEDAKIESNDPDKPNVPDRVHFSKILQIFGGLDLGCSKRICV